MKTKLLWTLILAVGSVALYCGLVRPEVPTDPRWIRDYREKDPATQPAIQLPPLVVSEPRLPAEPVDSADPPSNAER